MRIWTEVLSHWKRNFSLQITSTATIGLCFTTVLVLGLITKNLESSFSSWGSKIEVSVYLSDDIDSKEKSKIEEALGKLDFVKSYSYQGKEKAKEGFVERFSGVFPELQSLEDDNPFPASYELSIKPISVSMFSIQYLEGIKDKLVEIEGVEEVGYGQYWFESYSGILRGLRSSVFLVAAILSLASLLIIANAIRAMVFRKKREVEILELIGATSQWIRAPFVANGILSGFLASAMACVLSYVIHALIVSKFASSFRALGISTQIGYFNLGEVGIILLFGGIVGGLGSYLCIRQINNGWSAIDTQEA